MSEARARRQEPCAARNAELQLAYTRCATLGRLLHGFLPVGQETTPSPGFCKSLACIMFPPEDAAGAPRRPMVTQTTEDVVVERHSWRHARALGRQVLNEPVSDTIDRRAPAGDGQANRAGSIASPRHVLAGNPGALAIQMSEERRQPGASARSKDRSPSQRTRVPAELETRGEPCSVKAHDGSSLGANSTRTRTKPGRERAERRRTSGRLPRRNVGPDVNRGTRRRITCLFSAT